MDDKIRELIAIGASITAHCQPCLVYHVGKAREMGIDEQEIREAVAVGYKVEKGAMSAMRDLAETFLDSPARDDPARCAGKPVPDAKKYCS